MTMRAPIFHGPHLVGNGAWCSTCFPDGAPATGGSFVDATRWAWQIRPGCNECAGEGRIVFSAEEIVAASIAARCDRRAA